LNNDYLKYWRVIRQYIKVKYGLTQSDLDIILFLNSEGYFDKDKFSEFDSILSWDEQRFNKLLRDGWIEVFRKRKGKVKGLYMLPTSPSQNPMFLKNVSYSDKQYRKAIMNMNEFIRQQRHLSAE